MPIRPARPSRSRKMHSPLPSPRSTAWCSSEVSTPSSAITFATSTRSEERNAKTPEMQFVTCSFSRSPAFCETRIRAVLRDRPIRDTSGTSLAPCGRRRDRPRLVQEDRLGQPPVHSVEQPAGELGHQVQQGDRQPLLVGVVVAADRGVGQRQPGQGEHRGPARRVDPLAARRARSTAGPAASPTSTAAPRRGSSTPGRSACSRCRTTLPRLGRSRPATAATAWIIALSRSSLIRGSSSRSVSVAMVRFSARSSPNENGSSRPGAAAAERQHPGLAAALRPAASTSDSASPLGSITATVTPRSASWQDEQQRQGGLAAARLTGDGDRGGPVAGRREQRVEMHDGPGPAQGLADVGADPAAVPPARPAIGRSPRSTVAVGTPPAIVYSGWRCTYDVSRTRSPGSDSHSSENWSPVELTTSMPMSR